LRFRRASSSLHSGNGFETIGYSPVGDPSPAGLEPWTLDQPADLIPICRFAAYGSSASFEQRPRHVGFTPTPDVSLRRSGPTRRANTDRCCFVQPELAI